MLENANHLEKLKQITSVACLIFFTQIALAKEEDRFNIPKESPAVGLPFFIAEEKKLDDEEINDKKEGFYITGLPNLSVDPVNGVGYGANLFLYLNGSRNDPFFPYTPYRTLLEISGLNTVNGEKEAAIGLDVPYIFDSQWRLRVNVSYLHDPNALYFGIGQKTLRPLSYNGNAFSTYQQYSDELDKTLSNGGGSFNNHYYNFYNLEESNLNLSIERSYWQSKLRAFFGLEISYNKITTYDNASYEGVSSATTLITQDILNGNIPDYSRRFVNFLQFGLIYDTRNFEPNPSRGMMMEIIDSYSPFFLGSGYEFNKLLYQFKLYTQILPDVFSNSIFAMRFGLTSILGDAPFFEYEDIFGSEDSVITLGGVDSLRGYKEGRFSARWTNFINFELRHEVFNLHLLEQKLAFFLVPFFDLGTVWDDFSQITFYHYRFSEGVGARIVWNASTVIRLDYGVSGEDQQLFFGFQQTF